MTMLIPRAQANKHSLTEQAYAAVKRKILSLDLPPGAQFTEAQISTELVLGKTPVHEALARLQREQLVECIPRCGYRVAPLTFKDIRDLFAVRVLLESEAVRLASANSLNEGHVRRLEELSLVVYRAEDSKQLAADVATNTEFHVLLAEGSGNSRLVSLIRDVMEHMERVVHIGISMTPANQIDRREHPDLLKAVLRGDAGGAVNLVEAQNRAWQDRMVDILLSSEAVMSTNLGRARGATPHLRVVGTRK
jgi:DNA-binding GntR family transcriptional regulator